MYIFKKKQIALGLPEHSLMQDVETRWNSTYKMMERVCEQQASICAALVDVKRLDLMLQSDDIKIIEKIIQILQPFFQITESVSGESYGTLSSIRPLLYHLLNDALSPTSDDPGVVKQLKEAVKKNLQQRYQSTEVSKLLDVACFLDPCFKELPFLSAEERSTLHNTVRDDAAALYIELSSQSSQKESNEVSVFSATPTSNDDDHDSGPVPPRKKAKSSAEAVRTILAGMFQQSESSNNTKEPEDVAEIELVSYLREKPVLVNSGSEEDNTDPLEW